MSKLSKKRKAGLDGLDTTVSYSLQEATDIVKNLYKKKNKIGLIKSSYPLLWEGINSQSELRDYRKIIV